jgi:hypothetical protein
VRGRKSHAGKQRGTQAGRQWRPHETEGMTHRDARSPA